MPDSYQAICRDILQILVLFEQEIIGGQSAGNLLSLNFLGILRDYTLEFFCCTIPIIVEKSSLTDNDKFSYYLAGLIEAVGTIIVPKTERSEKGRLNYPSIQIIFDSRDLSLALIIHKELGGGSLSKKKELTLMF
jgi:hypothetical protein